MPINAYTGLMGSGKSYEVVSSVIVKAIGEGRNVVTNVDGIDSDAIRAYCVDKLKKDVKTLGIVRHCSNDDVFKADFLPHGTEDETFCKPGEMVCIDEAWRFWGTDCKLLDEHKIFFREHRHYVDEKTKVSSDLILMIQDISDLHRVLKVVVELTFRTTKLKALGLNKAYKVEMWEGYKLTKGSRVAVEQKKYNKEIYPLYSSYSGGVGKEVQVDSRQNIFNSKKLWFLIVLCIGLFISGVYFVVRFFNPASHGVKAVNPSVVAANQSKSIQPVQASGQAAAVPSGPSPSDSYRISGTFIRDGIRYVVLTGQAGIRVEPEVFFLGEGRQMFGVIQGQKFTYNSGVSAPSVAQKAVTGGQK